METLRGTARNIWHRLHVHGFSRDPGPPPGTRADVKGSNSADAREQAAANVARQMFGGIRDDALPLKSHVASFDLDGVPVSVWAANPIVLGEGDRVVVAGVRRRGALRGYAYYNITRKILGHEAYLFSLILGLFGVAVGVMTLAFGSSSCMGRGRCERFEPLTVESAFAFALFSGFGVWQIYTGWRVKRAIGLLKKWNTAN